MAIGFTKSVAGMVPGMLSLSLLGRSVQMIPKNFRIKGVQKANSKNLIKGFVPIMVGIPMIKPVSGMVAAL